jgi:signal transduction histidine kinase
MPPSPNTPIHVLLVDDDEDELVITRGLLGEIEGERFEIDWAPEFNQALEALDRKCYDVCLCDYRLGANNGVEFIRQAVDRGCRAPIILLTSQGDHAVDLAAMRAGASDYLNKSHLTADVLERSIRYSIQQRRSEDQRIHLLQEQAARGEAEAANRAKDEFLATLSHELRTPLNAILGWVQLMRMGSLDEETMRQAVETIERNAKAQAQLIEDLLDVTRIVSGKIRLHSVPVKLDAIIAAALDAVRPAAENKSIQLTAELQGDCPMVLGDPTRLQQVVWNLLTNAIKFTPSRGDIDVTLRCEDGEHAVISITDSGQGIDPAFLPHVFERFRQADASTTRPHSGLGLGLAIVRNLVELHGGHVCADSPGKGQGSTFTITLPTTHQGQSPAAPVASPPSETTGASLKGLSVVVVDDEPDARGFVERALAMEGASVRAASTANEAFSLIALSPPDLLVSDIAMPEEDGYALLRRIRASADPRIRSLTAIAITAYATDLDRRRALDAGFAVHLSKPLEPLDLTRVIRELRPNSHP